MSTIGGENMYEEYASWRFELNVLAAVLKRMVSLYRDKFSKTLYSSHSSPVITHHLPFPIHCKLRAISFCNHTA